MQGKGLSIKIKGLLLNILRKLFYIRKPGFLWISPETILNAEPDKLQESRSVSLTDIVH